MPTDKSQPQDDSRPQRDETSDTERERVPSSNDREQQLDREGLGSEHNGGSDKATDGRHEDVDPDSAESEIDRDDTIDD